MLKSHVALLHITAASVRTHAACKASQPMCRGDPPKHLSGVPCKQLHCSFRLHIPQARVAVRTGCQQLGEWRDGGRGEGVMRGEGCCEAVITNIHMQQQC